MQLKTGHLLAGGRYRVERVLGQGGFGITYLAEQTGLARKVAIKEFFMREYCERVPGSTAITQGSSGSRGLVDRFREKFIKEARAIARLSHKHIVRIIDVFEENNTAYYVMEYVGGGPLSEKSKGRALPEEAAVRYIRQVASALDYVHSQRMMHLDVKPGNLLLNSDDEAVLIDFGLSKQYDMSGEQTSSTPVGISHGYAPLEQYKRGGVGTFSPATDIYSLGATLYRLLTGETPPEAADVSDEGLPALPEGLSAPVRRAVEAAMQPGRRNRPQSIGEFLALLENGNVKTENGKEDDDGETVVIPVIPTKRSEKSQKDDNAADNGGTMPDSLKWKGEPQPADRVILNNSEKSPKKSSGKKWFIIAAVAIIAVVAVILGIKSCDDKQSDYDRKREARRERMERSRQAIEEAERDDEVVDYGYDEYEAFTATDYEEAVVDSIVLIDEPPALTAPEPAEVNEALERQRAEEERRAREAAERRAREEAERLAAEARRERLEEESAEEEIFQVVEQPAEFPGGMQAMYKWLSENIEYPCISRDNNSQGRTILRFVVNSDGSIQNIEVIKSSGDMYLDKEAVRVVGQMPKWSPGKQAGKAVRCWFTLPVMFRLV